jgi:hypothetical protein
LTETRDTTDFTIYLEGHDGHRGNVLVHAFVGKVHRVVLVLNRLERAFIDSATRHTDFEIVGADKRNPTTLTLKPVPHVKAYDPKPAFDWAMHQLAAVARGDEPDERVRGEIAKDLVKLATKDSEDGYKAFWINGRAEAVKFDDDFLRNALALTKVRAADSSSTRWHTGSSIGSIVGQLRAVDDITDEREFVIVPPTGPTSVTCVFPESLRDTMGDYLFQMVRVEGTLHYGKESPFPYRVEAKEGGIAAYPTRKARRTLEELRGVFEGKGRSEPDWGSLLNVG